jgi:hypothetical protein
MPALSESGVASSEASIPNREATFPEGSPITSYYEFAGSGAGHDAEDREACHEGTRELDGAPESLEEAVVIYKVPTLRSVSNQAKHYGF